MKTITTITIVCTHLAKVYEEGDLKFVEAETEVGKCREEVCLRLLRSTGYDSGMGL